MWVTISPSRTLRAPPQGGEDVGPIPGTLRVKYLDENSGALNVHRTLEEVARIDVLPVGAAAGERHQPQAMLAVNR